jgi:hypothetical protein
MSNIATSIYQGSASYGRFVAIIGAVIATLLSLFLIFFGIKFANSVDLYIKSTPATITGKSCTPGEKNQQGSCLYTLSYFDENGQKIENVTLTTSADMPLNSQMNISYNPANKTDIRLTSENTKGTGYMMIFIGILISGFAWGWVWITRKYEFAASASGISSAFNLFKN